MSDLVFSARFTPNSSATISSTVFDVAASVFDGTGVFSGLDVAVNDVVYIDAFPSISAPNTIARFKVTQINSQGPSSVNVRLTWDDSGTVVDPGECTGTQGFISRATVTDRFAFHAAPTLHSIPDYVIQYSRNKELVSTIEGNLGGGGGGTSLSKVMQNSGTTIAAGKPVGKKPDGTIVLADSDGVNTQNFCGITSASMAPSATGIILIPGQNIAGAITGLGFAPGDSVFLNESGGYSNTTSGFSGDNDTIWKIGMADCASGLASPTATDIIIMTEKLISP